MGSAIQAGGQGPEHPLTFRERPTLAYLDGFVRRPSPECLRPASGS